MIRPSDFSTAYLDSCVLIKHIVQPEDCPEITGVMQLIDAGKLTGVISAVHWVEVLGKQRSEAFDQEREDLAQSLLLNPRLSVVDVGPHVLRRAREYALHRRFKPMDAIHMASAVEAGAAVLMTYDEMGPGLEHSIDGVWLDRPYEPGEPTLFGN